MLFEHSFLGQTELSLCSPSYCGNINPPFWSQASAFCLLSRQFTCSFLQCAAGLWPSEQHVVEQGLVPPCLSEEQSSWSMAWVQSLNLSLQRIWTSSDYLHQGTWQFTSAPRQCAPTAAFMWRWQCLGLRGKVAVAWLNRSQSHQKRWRRIWTGRGSMKAAE